MSVKSVGAFLVAVCGSFGLVSVHLFAITPTPALRWAIAAAFALAFVAIAAIRRRKPVGATDEFKPLLRNAARRRRQPWVLVDKTCSVVVSEAGGHGRDARIAFDWVVLNRSKRAVGNVEFAILGGSWIQEGDLDVWVEVSGQPANRASVRCADGYSPIILVPMPAPGLASGSAVSVRLWWLWPGLVSMRSERWILDLAQMLPGASARIRLDYPSDWLQVAEARLIKSFAGFEWDLAKGAITAKRTVAGLRFDFEHLAGRRDSLVCIDMRAMPAPPPSTSAVGTP